MAEPTSEWGKQLKEAVAEIKETCHQLDSKADITKERIESVADRVGDTKEHVNRVESSLGGRITGFEGNLIQATEKIGELSGLKTLVLKLSVVFVVLVSLAGGGNLVATLSTRTGVMALNRIVGGLEANITSLNDATVDLKNTLKDVDDKAGNLGGTIGELNTQFATMDQRFQTRLDDFDVKLASLAEKISELEKVSLGDDLQQLDAKANRIEAKIDGIQSSLDKLPRGNPNITARRLQRITEFRSLTRDDQDFESHLPGFVFGLSLPELFDPSLVEEVSAGFHVAATRSLGAPLTVMTQIDHRGKLLIAVLGADQIELDRLLATRDGLPVSITYLVREP